MIYHLARWTLTWQLVPLYCELRQACQAADCKARTSFLCFQCNISYFFFWVYVSLSPLRQIQCFLGRLVKYSKIFTCNKTRRILFSSTDSMNPRLYTKLSSWSCVLCWYRRDSRSEWNCSQLHVHFLQPINSSKWSRRRCKVCKAWTLYECFKCGNFREGAPPTKAGSQQCDGLDGTTARYLQCQHRPTPNTSGTYLRGGCHPSWGIKGKAEGLRGGRRPSGTIKAKAVTEREGERESSTATEAAGDTTRRKEGTYTGSPAATPQPQNPPTPKEPTDHTSIDYACDTTEV